MSANFRQLHIIVDCQDDMVILHKPLKKWGYGTYLFLPNGERYYCCSRPLSGLEESPIIVLSECSRFVRIDDEEIDGYGMYERSVLTVKCFDAFPRIVCGSVLTVMPDWYDDKHNARAEYFRGSFNGKIERTLKYFKVSDYQLPDPTKTDIYGFPKRPGE